MTGIEDRLAIKETGRRGRLAEMEANLNRQLQRAIDALRESVTDRSLALSELQGAQNWLKSCLAKLTAQYEAVHANFGKQGEKPNQNLLVSSQFEESIASNLDKMNQALSRVKQLIAQEVSPTRPAAQPSQTSESFRNEPKFLHFGRFEKLASGVGALMVGATGVAEGAIGTNQPIIVEAQHGENNATLEELLAEVPVMPAELAEIFNDLIPNSQFDSMIEEITQPGSKPYTGKENPVAKMVAEERISQENPSEAETHATPTPEGTQPIENISVITEDYQKNPEQESIPDFIMVGIVTKGNVRSEASLNAPVTDSLANIAGNEAKIVGIVEGESVDGNSSWYRVEINGQVWFAHSSLFVNLSTEQQNILDQIETKRLEEQLFAEHPAVEPSGHAPQESGTLMVNSGGEYPWSNENWYPSEFTRIDELITQRKSDLLLALQQSGVNTSGVEISVGWNGKSGNELKISLFAFKQLDDGSFQVFWPKNETHSGLSYNSAVWPSYEFVTFIVPAGIEIVYGFNDGDQNPYLLLKIDGQVFAALDTSRVLEAGQMDTIDFTSSVFWKYVEGLSGVMPENALQKLLNGEMSVDEFREVIKEMMPQLNQYTQENVHFDPQTRTIIINGQEYPVLYLQGSYNTKMEQPIYKGEQEPGDVEFIFTGIALETPNFEQHMDDNGIEDSQAYITVVIPLPSGQEVFAKFSASLIAPGEGEFAMRDQYGNLSTMDIQDLLQIKPGQQVQISIYHLFPEELLRTLWAQTPEADPDLLEPTVNFTNYFVGSAQQLYLDIINGTPDPGKTYEVGGFSEVGIYPPFTSN